jgi:precorrin-2 dehydrogenase/sirohydrochlorin ferrochelatase
MFPIMLDLGTAPVALVGNGLQAVRRLALLDEDRATGISVYAPTPSDALTHAAGSRLRQRLPTVHEVAAARLLLVADGIDSGAARDLVATARAAGTIANVEDRPELSDFHSPATVRRGDLLLTVSTGGRSPALARRLGRFLAEVFGPEWQARVEDLARLRVQWRESGADPASVSQWTEEWVVRFGNLPAVAETATALQNSTALPTARVATR